MKILKWIWTYVKRLVKALLNMKCCPECNCKA